MKNELYAPETLCSLPETALLESADGYQPVSLESYHLSKGRIIINEPITSATTASFASAMRYLADEKKEVDIYINSPGGEVIQGLLIYDIIQSYKHPINIYCTGIAASMAAVILAGGQKGRRFILPHSKVMIHEPLIPKGFGGSATTIEKAANSILETRELINGILARHTGKDIAEINEATVFDNLMDAEAAVEFGICDEVRNLFN